MRVLRVSLFLNDSCGLHDDICVDPSIGGTTWKISLAIDRPVADKVFVTISLTTTQSTLDGIHRTTLVLPS
jgi:hypothetical protein